MKSSSSQEASGKNQNAQSPRTKSPQEKNTLEQEKTLPTDIFWKVIETTMADMAPPAETNPLETSGDISQELRRNSIKRRAPEDWEMENLPMVPKSKVRDRSFIVQREFVHFRALHASDTLFLCKIFNFLKQTFFLI